MGRVSKSYLCCVKRGMILQAIQRKHFAKAIREERPREVEEVKRNLLARLEHEGPLKGLGNVGLYSNNRKGKEMFKPSTYIGSTLARSRVR